MTIQPIRGMNDLLPASAATWAHLETIVREVVESYDYRELRLPIMERTELFQRSIGEATDIVEKEMYTFKDRNGESLTLRPEATAGMVRAGLSNGLLHNQRQKLWTSGPMFRYEKPQKGRYRQFYQFDVEALGYAGPDIDAELIILCARLWQRLGLSRLTLELNSLGSDDARRAYREELVRYFSAMKNRLDEDSIRRLDKNPLRILDSKHPETAELVKDAPVLLDFLDAESAEHFAELRSLLDEAGVEYRVNPRLVRGLDYYSRTVFEWITDALGSQGAVCSGGRYDGLVAKLGGKALPAIGWAMGMERLAELYDACGGETPSSAPAVFLVAVGDGAVAKSLSLAEALRDQIAGVRVATNLGGGSFKAQLKRADKSGAEFALLMGEDELSKNQVGLKPLRSREEQQSIALDRIVDELRVRLADSGAA